MPATEQLRGLKDLLIAAFSGGVGTVAEMHAAIARYPFGILETLPVTRHPATALSWECRWASRVVTRPPHRNA